MLTMTKSELLGLIADFRSLPWEIGDAMVELERDLGARAFAVFQETGLSDAQLYDLIRMAHMWAPAERNIDLSWSYYRDAGADKEVARRLLEATHRNGWSREQLRKALRAIRRHEQDDHAGDGKIKDRQCNECGRSGWSWKPKASS